MIGIAYIYIFLCSLLNVNQPDKELNSILNHHYEAVHMEALCKIESLEMNGANYFFRNKDSFEQNDPFLKGSYQKIIIKNKIFYEDINDTVYNDSQTFHREYCISKKGAWIKDGSGVKDWEFGSADSIHISSMIDIEGPLYRGGEKGHQMQFIGKRKVSGKSFHCIKLTSHEGYTIYYYLDIKSGFIIWVSNNEEYSEGYNNPVNFYSDYKEVNNVYLPFYIESRSSFMNETTYVVRKLERISVNKKIDYSLFDR